MSVVSFLAILFALTFGVANSSGAAAGAEPGAATESADSEAKDRVRGAAHAPNPDSDGFHVTAFRTWYFHDFLPDGEDADTVGFELNSAWALGDFAFTNISYFEVAAYDDSVPGMPIGNPDPQPGGGTGITDLLSAFLVSKKGVHHDNHHFSLGLATQIPTASDSALGSGQWSLGPAIEYEYENGRFFGAFVALQLWSVLGDDDRKDVNMLMIKPMVTYEIFEKWKLVYMPYGISVYWNKDPGQKVYLPIGAGIQRDFGLWNQELAVSAQFFRYVVRPDKGSKWDLRFMLEFDF